MKAFNRDKLNVRVFKTRESMGDSAASEVSDAIAEFDVNSFLEKPSRIYLRIAATV